MRVDIILADSAQSGGGKAHILGAGWSVVSGPDGAGPMSVVVFVEVPWNETGRRVEFLLELLDADGHTVPLPVAPGKETLAIEGHLEAMRPEGLPLGTPVALQPVTIQVGFMPLEPGRYVWRVSLDGETKEEWQRGFTRVYAPAVGLG